MLSEPSKPVPNAGVERWLRDNRRELWLPVFVIDELRFGAEKLPPSRKRSQLEEYRAIVLRQYGGRIVDFDQAAAEAHAVLRAKLQRIGKSIAAPDSYIAAIALTRGASVATHNLSDYENTGLKLIDPWAS